MFRCSARAAYPNLPKIYVVEAIKQTLMVFSSDMSNFAFLRIALRMYWIANFT